jgi:quercetin dioxygenase-like cupin family protein
MRMPTTLVGAVAFGLAVPFAAVAQDSPLPEGFATEPVIQTTTNREGNPITLPTGTPEIISVVATLEPDGRTPLHQHPVPVYVYMLEGEIEVRTEGAEPQRYAAGEAFIEAQNSMHQAFNVGDAPAKLLVVIVGAEGQPPTITPES